MNMTNLQLFNAIKRRLGVPYTFFELDFQDVVAILHEKTFRYFSQWIPARGYATINAKTARVEGLKGTYKIPTESDIVSVIDIYPSNSDLVVNYPLTPINSGFEQSTQMVVKTLEAIPNLETSSALHYTWEFMLPNMIKLFPDSFGFQAMVVYFEYVHESLETIPNTFGGDFFNLILADIYDTLADIRGKYQQISTPFGDIQLNSDTLRSQAENLRSSVYERLQSIPPNIIVKGI